MSSILQRATFLAFALTATMTARSPAGDTADDAWRSFDGTAFPILKWLPADRAKPKAVVVCVHGLSGAAADFEQLGEKLSAAGHATYAYALRGQGNDPDKRRIGDIRKREHWFADFDSFVTRARTLHPDTPVFVYGESLGSLIVMHGFADMSDANRASVKGLIYGSPVVALPGDLPPLKVFLVRALIKLLPGIKVSILKLAGDQNAQVTDDADTDHWEQMRKTPHFVERLSFRLIGTLESMVKECAAAAGAIDTPVLVLYPGHDLFTKPAQVEAFYESLGAKDKTKRLFAKSHHLLFYDKERDALFALVEKWLGERL